jgi:hypothetical protein
MGSDDCASSCFELILSRKFGNACSCLGASS